MKAIYILWLRQIKRYIRTKTRIIGSLGQPLLFLFALGLGFGPIYAKAEGEDYIQFLSPGIIAMSILFTATFSGIEILWDRQFGFLKEILVAPVSRLNIMIGRTLGGATVAVLQGTIVFVLSFLFGFRPTNPYILPVALIFMLLIAITFTALGTAIACIIEDMQGFQIVVNFLIMPIFFLSGALFPIRRLPKIVAFISSINPLTYGVDGLRTVLVNGSVYGIGMDLMVVISVAFAFLILGAHLFSKIQI